MTKTQVSEKVSILKNLHLQEDQYIEDQFPLICLKYPYRSLFSQHHLSLKRQLRNFFQLWLCAP